MPSTRWREEGALLEQKRPDAKEGGSGLAGVGAVLCGRGNSAGNDRKRAYQPDGLIGPDWSSRGGAGSGGDPGTGRAVSLESGEVGRRMASRAVGGNPESTRKGAGPGAETGRVPLGRRAGVHQSARVRVSPGGDASAGRSPEGGLESRGGESEGRRGGVSVPPGVWLGGCLRGNNLPTVREATRGFRLGCADVQLLSAQERDPGVPLPAW